MSFRLIFGVLICLAVLTAPIYGQGTGSITGTVRDNTGAVVPNAAITLTDVGTQNTIDAKTNAEGEFLVAALPPGVYNLDVTATGFNRYQAKGIVLRVSQRARVDIALTVGEIVLTVVVGVAGATVVVSLPLLLATPGEILDGLHLSAAPTTSHGPSRAG